MRVKPMIHLMIGVISLFLLTSCTYREENKVEFHEPEVESEPLILEEAPAKIQCGNIRLLCSSENDLVLNEIVSRFNKSHEEQIEMLYPENEGAIDSEAYYNMVLSGEYDILVDTCYPVLRTLVEAGYLMPMDDLIGDEVEKEEYLQSVLNAGRVEETLYFFTPFFDVRAMRIEASVPREAVSDIGGLLDYIRSNPEVTEDLERLEANLTEIFHCGSGLDQWMDYKNLVCDFTNPEFEQLLELDEIIRKQSREGGNTAHELFSDPVYDATVALTWSEEWSYYPFPMEAGQGYTIDAGKFFAVSSKAQNSGTVEAFLTFLLSDEIQEMETNPVPNLYAVYMDLPVRRSALQKILKRRGTRSRGGMEEEALNEWIDQCITICEQADHFSFYGLLDLYVPYYHALTLPLAERSAFLEKEANAQLALWREKVYGTR